LKQLVAFTTSRRHGNARRPETLRKILAAHRAQGPMATAKQVHGTRVRVIPKLSRPRHYPGVDGFLTAEIGQPLGIFTADCAPIFLSAPSHGVIGLLHAGWKGVRGGILREALRKLRQRWSIRSSAVRLWLGPSIGPCCFEVQWDVARHFPASRKRWKDRWTVDLQKEVRAQAKRAGAVVINARDAGCTRHQSRYYSFRRDQTNHRQISVILRKS
jgi:YfiH family protein